MTPEQFITDVMLGMKALQEQEGVTKKEMARRLQIAERNVRRRFEGWDMRLSLVARWAHALGYKVRVIYERED